MGLYLVCNKYHYSDLLSMKELSNNDGVDMCTALTMQAVSRPGYWE